MKSRRRHYIYPDLDTLAAAFVCDLSRFLAETAKEDRIVHLAISGGSTPLTVFQQIARVSSPGDWSHVRLYWGDERCVPPGDQDSNYGNALESLIEPLHLPGEHIYRIRGEDEPEKEAERYGRLLLEQLPVINGFPVFDWIWLGMGEDGHTASIFPGQENLWHSPGPCVVSTHPGTGRKRVSITGGVINAARRVAFLVAGQSKSRAMNEIVMKEGRYLDYPAFHVSPEQGDLEWYLDMEVTNWLEDES
jgi:6-phosphogluconolactonase